MLRESTYPLYSGVLNKETLPGSRATVFSIASQANSLGQIAGGPILGMIATYLSLRMGLLGTALMLLPVLLLFYIALQKISVTKIIKANTIL